VSRQQDYNSHNTDRLTVNQMADVLLKLEYVQRELGEWVR